MHRGVRRKDLFEEEMDYQVFLEILKSGLKKYECKLTYMKKCLELS